MVIRLINIKTIIKEVLIKAEEKDLIIRKLRIKAINK